MRSRTRIHALLPPFLAANALVFGQASFLASADAVSSTQDSSVPSSTSSKASATSSIPASTHTISVGNGDHKFKPDITQANVGDIIEFGFFPANHSVVRAEYTYPCIPYEMTGKDKVGFFSGFHPVDTILSDPPQWRLKINDTYPIFFYCSAPGSCIDYGMVGVINPNASTSLETQRQLAHNSAYMLQPGDPFPSEASPTPPSMSPSPPPTPAKHTLSTPAIAGIVVAAVALLALGALLCFFIGRSKTLQEGVLRRNATLPYPSPGSPGISYASSPAALLPAYFSPDAYPPGVQRTTSQRSAGGTFGLSPTGCYVRTREGEHDAADTFKFAQVASVAETGAYPDWKEVPVDAYGGQCVGDDKPRSPNETSNRQYAPGAQARDASVQGRRVRSLHVNDAGQPAELCGVEIAGRV